MPSSQVTTLIFGSHVSFGPGDGERKWLTCWPVVLSGSCKLHNESEFACELTEGDAWTVPSNYKTTLTNMSGDFSLLEVSLPARFDTTMHEGSRSCEPKD